MVAPFKIAYLRRSLADLQTKQITRSGESTGEKRGDIVGLVVFTDALVADLLYLNQAFINRLEMLH